MSFTCSHCGSTTGYDDRTGVVNFVSSIYFCMDCGIAFANPDKFSTPTINFMALTDHAITPTKANPGDVAFDLYSAYDYTIDPGKIFLAKTDIALELPDQYEAQIRQRSGNAKNGLTIPNAPGTIDSQYRGNVGVLLQNHNDIPWEIKKGDRIAQMVIAKRINYILEEVASINETVRGAGGFGSTGK